MLSAHTAMFSSLRREPGECAPEISILRKAKFRTTVIPAFAGMTVGDSRIFQGTDRQDIRSQRDVTHAAAELAP
jgi:hypothetical protein